MFELLLILAITNPASAPASSPASMPEPPPRHSIVYSNVLGSRLNPLGLGDQLRISYRFRLYDSRSPLLETAHIGAGIQMNVSPAFLRVGPVLTFAPLAIFQLQLAYELVGFFGTFQSVLPFTSADADAGDIARKQLNDAKQSRAMVGSLFSVNLTLQGKAGPIVVRVQLQIGRYDLPTAANETVFYDVNYDLLLPTRGLFLHQDADVIYMTPFGFSAGARHSLTHSLNDAPRSAAGFGGLNSLHRLGPVFVYEIFDKPGASFNKPTVALLVQWHLQHRYRTGAEVSAALPQFIVAFSFSGELWRK